MKNKIIYNLKCSNIKSFSVFQCILSSPSVKALRAHCSSLILHTLHCKLLELPHLLNDFWLVWFFLTTVNSFQSQLYSSSVNTMPEPFNVLLLIHIWSLIWRTILMLFKDSLLRSTFTLYFLSFFLMCVCVCGLLHYVILLRIFFYQTFSWGDINFFSYRADMILEEWLLFWFFWWHTKRQNLHLSCWVIACHLT